MITIKLNKNLNVLSTTLMTTSKSKRNFSTVKRIKSKLRRNKKKG